MSVLKWEGYLGELERLLRSVSCRATNRKELGADAGFVQWKNLTIRMRRKRRTIYLIGNGASASMASHMAADLAKNAHLHTEVFFDSASITAISNDMGYEHVFSEPLSRRASPGDMLVVVSSSGRSPSVLSAVRVASRFDMTIVTLSAMDADNPLRKLGSLNFYVAATTYSKAETCHAAILHHWMDLVEANRSQ